MLYLTLRLTPSVRGQKVEVKPVGNYRGRSQDGAVMGRSDVADLPSGAGLPLGRDSGRASALLAKSVFSASTQRSLGATHAVSGVLTLPVRHAVMPRTRKVHSTDEVLRCLNSWSWVTAGYKPNAKCPPHAPVTGTVSPRPRLRGWQQRRSRDTPIPSNGKASLERQNLRVPLGSPRYMGPVSPAAQAAKWPDGTSSHQAVGSLRNTPQRAGVAPAAVHPR